MTRHDQYQDTGADSDGRNAVEEEDISGVSTETTAELDPDVLQIAADLLRSDMPTCTCTGWHDVVDHEIACARTQHRVALDRAMRSLPDQLEAAVASIARLESDRDILTAAVSDARSRMEWMGTRIRALAAALEATP